MNNETIPSYETRQLRPGNLADLTQEELIGAIPTAFNLFTGARALAETAYEDREQRLNLARAHEEHLNGLLEALHEKLESPTA